MNDREKKQYLNSAYEKHAEEIYRFCLARVHAKEIAEDLLQETFIRAWKYIVRNKKIKNLRAFLFQISRNLIFDFFRKNSQEIKKGKEMILSAQSDESTQTVFDKRCDFENKDLLEEVFCTIKKLPSSDQEVLILRYVEEFMPQEIAKILNTDPKIISARICKAKKKLNKIFKNNGKRQSQSLLGQA